MVTATTAFTRHEMALYPNTMGSNTPAPTARRSRPDRPAEQKRGRS